jgi:hypothetical protein
MDQIFLYEKNSFLFPAMPGLTAALQNSLNAMDGTEAGRMTQGSTICS